MGLSECHRHGQYRTGHMGVPLTAQDQSHVVSQVRKQGTCTFTLHFGVGLQFPLSEMIALESLLHRYATVNWTDYVPRGFLVRSASTPASKAAPTKGLHLCPYKPAIRYRVNARHVRLEDDGSQSPVAQILSGHRNPKILQCEGSSMRENALFKYKSTPRIGGQSQPW